MSVLISRILEARKLDEISSTVIVSKAKIQILIDDAQNLSKKILGPMEPKADHNKYLLEAQQSMEQVISSLKEAKALAK